MPSESLPRNRDIWRIAAPMILSNISVPLLGMVDTGVTGHLDDPVYLGAVAIGSTIFGFIYAGFNFLRMGTTGITAQCLGAGRITADRHHHDHTAGSHRRGVDAAPRARDRDCRIRE